QSTTSGATSAATSARMIAIANPSSVVCTAPPSFPGRLYELRARMLKPIAGLTPMTRLERSLLAAFGAIVCPRCASSAELDDLAGVQDVERIERALDRAHGGKRRFAVLGQQILHFALADAMLAGTCSVHRQRALDQAFEESVDARDFLFVVEVHHQPDVEIAVADMADDRGNEITFGAIALRLGDTFGEPRDRNTDVGRQRVGTGAQPALRPIGIVASLPEPRAVLRPHRLLKWTTAEFLRDLAKALRLLGDARLGAVKFQEQHRHFRQRELRIGV